MTMTTTLRMRRLLFAAGFALLFVVAQQGALLHELSHVRAPHAGRMSVDPSLPDEPCTLCVAFAHVGALAEQGGAFDGALLDQLAFERVAMPVVHALATSAPAPRSRGPPSGASL